MLMLNVYTNVPIVLIFLIELYNVQGLMCKHRQITVMIISMYDSPEGVLM